MERTFKVLILFLCLSFILVSFAIADEVQYIYDDVGRLTKVIKGSEAYTYNYDEVGNLLSITSDSVSASSPVLQSINPDVLFTGSITYVSIQGQNLFTTNNVASDNPDLSIKTLGVTDTEINIEISVSTDALPGATAIINVTTAYGSANISIDILNLELSPATVYLLVGGTEEITASITPPRAINLNIVNNNPDIITTPQSVSIPPGGSASFIVQAIVEGVGVIEVDKSQVTTFVTAPFTGDASIGANPVSIQWPWVDDAIIESKPVCVEINTQ